MPPLTDVIKDLKRDYKTAKKVHWRGWSLSSHIAEQPEQQGNLGQTRLVDDDRRNADECVRSAAKRSSVKTKREPVESNDDACLTVEQVARLLQTSKDRVYQLVYSGKLRAISLLTLDEQERFGRRNLWRVQVKEYRRFVERNKP